MLSIDLSIIIPNHNEPNIKEFADTCQALYPEAQIIVSTDKLGKGKGWAVREGIKRATGSIVAIIDGDGDIHPKYIDTMLMKDYDVVVGSKPITSLLSLFSRILIKLLFGLNDTQTGIKVFHKRAIFYYRTDGFAFDIEMLYKAKQAGYKIGSVAVKTNKPSPKSIGVVLKTLWDTIKIRLSV